jgi:hypothetical protein
MMDDSHDSAQRAGEALAAASVEAEAQATGGGPVPSGSATLEAAAGGGSSRRARLLQRQRPKGELPVGLRCSLSDTAPEPAVGGRNRHPRDPLTYSTHHTRAAQRVAATAKRKEHQGPPRLTKRGRI